MRISLALFLLESLFVAMRVYPDKTHPFGTTCNFFGFRDRKMGS